MTQPPQPFTDATLLAAMTNIARFVSDPKLRKTLRETDGLGTEATRAAIIETLFRRDYLVRESRHIRSTEKGRSLIHALPEAISQPDMTAVWEATLEEIRGGDGDRLAVSRTVHRGHAVEQASRRHARRSRPAGPGGGTSCFRRRRWSCNW